MCAGISFLIDVVRGRDLDRFLTDDELDKKRKGDLVESFYWDAKPYLPVYEDDEVNLYPWGDREGRSGLPKTGWAKIESVRDGIWNAYSPKKVLIPSYAGYEKRHWFKTPQGIQGIKVRIHNITRVYILTAKADRQFLRIIGHDRMPMGEIIYN